MIKTSYRKVKLLVSGSVVEFVGQYGLSNFSKELLSDDEKKELSIRRARNNLRRKINANCGNWFNEDTRKPYVPLFVTLTFRENVQDIPYANREYSKFVQRFNLAVYGSKRAVLKYATVIEFQDRGAVHYHSVFFNCPFIPHLQEKLQRVWSHGFVSFSSIRHVANVGAYMVKYMTKDSADERLRGKKTFFTSRGLRKSLVLTDPFDVSLLLDQLGGDVWRERREWNAVGTDYVMVNLDRKSAMSMLNRPGVVFGGSKHSGIQIVDDVKPDELCTVQVPLF